MHAAIAGLFAAAAVLVVGRCERGAEPPGSVRSASERPSVAVPQPDADLAAVPRVPLSEAYGQIENREVVVIDVRAADAYVSGHIPGALHIPLARIEGEVAYLPRGKRILTYCT
jgi:3-mercaptopyruvate sulfurtransferase SseA